MARWRAAEAASADPTAREEAVPAAVRSAPHGRPVTESSAAVDVSAAATEPTAPPLPAAAAAVQTAAVAPSVLEDVNDDNDSRDTTRLRDPRRAAGVRSQCDTDPWLRSHIVSHQRRRRV